jgi:virulence-associated protein VagC
VAIKRSSPNPYVPAEVGGGRLVRVCPECREQIVETTDSAGIVSDNFSVHWKAEHQAQPVGRQRCYLIGLQPSEDDQPGPGPSALRDVSRQVLAIVKERMPEVDWELVEGVEDLPEEAPALIAYEVLRGSWGMEGDDPQVRKVRWYRREGDSLIFAPTKTQWSEWNAAAERARDVRAALIERHREELPKFRGKTVAGWERYYKRLSKQENVIAERFDAQRDAALHQFLCGDHRWLATLDGAIADLAIPDEEIDELRERRQRRREEVEAMLDAQPAPQ